MAKVEVLHDGARVDIVLNRPEVLNAMDWDVFTGLADAVSHVSDLTGARVVVVRGRGRSFCSGIDTSTFGDLGGQPRERIARAQKGFRALASLELPTIAAVHGHALGAGLQVALACDVRVVTEDASLGLLEAKYGIIPDLGGTQRLPHLVGPGQAKKMIWLAEKIDGRRAGELGLAEMTVPGDRLDDEVDRLATALAAAPPLTVQAVKRLVDGASHTPLSQGMDDEAQAQERALESSDFAEAIGAFIERRAPVFTGR